MKTGPILDAVYVAPEDREEIGAAINGTGVLVYRLGYWTKGFSPGLDSNDAARGVSRFLLLPSLVLDWRTPELRPPTGDEIAEGFPHSYIRGGVDAIALRAPAQSLPHELAKVREARDVSTHNLMRRRYQRPLLDEPRSALLDLDRHPEGVRSYPTTEPLAFLVRNAEVVLLWESLGESGLCCLVMGRSEDVLDPLKGYCDDSSIPFVRLPDSRRFPVW